MDRHLARRPMAALIGRATMPRANSKIHIKEHELLEVSGFHPESYIFTK